MTYPLKRIFALKRRVYYLSGIEPSVTSPYYLPLDHIRENSLTLLGKVLLFGRPPVFWFGFNQKSNYVSDFKKGNKAPEYEPVK